jgi:hypothetical protein
MMLTFVANCARDRAISESDLRNRWEYRVRIKFQYQDQLTLKQEPGWYPDRLFLHQEALS